MHQTIRMHLNWLGIFSSSAQVQDASSRAWDHQLLFQPDHHSGNLKSSLSLVWGDNIRFWTAMAPADWPKRVTCRQKISVGGEVMMLVMVVAFSGSPPRWPMFSWTKCKASFKSHIPWIQHMYDVTVAGQKCQHLNKPGSQKECHCPGLENQGDLACENKIESVTMTSFDRCQFQSTCNSLLPGQRPQQPDSLVHRPHLCQILVYFILYSSHNI